EGNDDDEEEDETILVNRQDDEEIMILGRRKWMDRGVVVGWKGAEQTYLLSECPLVGSHDWSGRERDTDGHTDLGTQLEGTKREATARAVPRRTHNYERNMMMNGKDPEEKERSRKSRSDLLSKSVQNYSLV
ncbi:hypothetical protein PRIPAC_70558, partial [Pristionchus pacificus]|uniref:Uncharacterized protein n=1 Tax=Pristionchus pacificus TaxID=54126 RepID=A0A2A6BRE8_PRIPA